MNDQELQEFAHHGTAYVLAAGVAGIFLCLLGLVLVAFISNYRAKKFLSGREKALRISDNE